MQGTQHQPSPQRMRRGAATLIRRVVDEACNNGNLAVLDEVLASSAPAGDAVGSDISVHDDAGSGHPIRQAPLTADPATPMVERLRELLAAFRAAVPDACWTIVDQVAGGDKVVTRLSVRGTLSGRLLGLAPPGRPATLTGVVISRFRAGRLVDLWLQADLLGLLQQLEVMPPLDLAQAVTMAQVQRAGQMPTCEQAPRTPPRTPARQREQQGGKAAARPR